ncbi:hypothetical protein BD289DRAFT_67128 [Coniella lustricola]|uniref:Uncharacterized protein n=1 Tax=Coniella lustricola TaxID=2025994 RepID=A0A2T3AHZ5_9PEZI|nr:hypothetical protein BD289DRAFT_67128 [Coniella lustricola]
MDQTTVQVSRTIFAPSTGLLEYVGQAKPVLRNVAPKARRAMNARPRLLEPAPVRHDSPRCHRRGLVYGVPIRLLNSVQAPKSRCAKPGRGIRHDCRTCCCSQSWRNWALGICSVPARSHILKKFHPPGNCCRIQRPIPDAQRNRQSARL